MDVTAETPSQATTKSVYATLFKTSRPPFLLLAISCVVAAVLIAASSAHSLEWFRVALISIAATAAHVAVNQLNEYQDFQIKLDFATQKTPFSGGSGALPASPWHSNAVRWSGITWLLLSILIGLWLTVSANHPPLLLAVGLLGVLLVVTYTPYLNRWPLLCFVSPGLGFGGCIFVGSVLALNLMPNYSVWLIALVIFVQTNSLLLLNQFPDTVADKAHGRRHIIVQYGYSKALVLLALNALVGISAVCVLAFMSNELGLLLVSFAQLLVIMAIVRAFKSFDGNLTADHLQAMGLNVALTLLLPITLAGWLCVVG